jgi:hypothetical protein
MNTTRRLGISALVAALALTLVGCTTTSEEAERVSSVEKARPLNTQVCNAPSWIREHAPAGLCESTREVDDNMSLRRLHEERQQR